MVQYGTKEDYVKDQVNSYKKSIIYLNQLKKRTENELLLDFRGDKEKILLAIEAGLKFLKKEKKNFLEENNY